MQRELQAMAPRLYAEYNRVVFDDRLPADLRISWSKTLQVRGHPSNGKVTVKTGAVKLWRVM